MRDDFDRKMNDALEGIINSRERPGSALTERVHKAAEARVKTRRDALLAAAGAGLTLNAALWLLTAWQVTKVTGGWIAVLAALIGLTLSVLPAVPLLALGEIPSHMQKQRNVGLEKQPCQY